MKLKKILFQSFYFKILHLIKCGTLFINIYLQFQSENCLEVNPTTNLFSEYLQKTNYAFVLSDFFVP